MKVVHIGTSKATRGGIGYVIASYWQTELRQRYEMFHVETHIDGSFLVKLVKFFKALINWFALRLKEGRMVVHVHTSVGASFMRKLFFIVSARMTGCPVILHIHSGSFARYYRSGSQLLKWVIRSALCSADTVVVLTPSWIPVVHEIAPECRRVKVVANPIDVEKYHPQTTESKPAGRRCELVYLGAIIEAKGVYDIVESVSALVHQGLDLHMTFAGDREIMKVQEMCLQNGIAGCVTFTGWADEKRKLELLRRADILLLPSFYEGLPLVVLEAMAAGVAVVCSDVGGLVDVVEDGKTGLIVSPGDVGSLSDAIKRLVLDEQLRKTIVINARAQAEERFALKVIARELDRIYLSRPPGTDAGAHA